VRLAGADFGQVLVVRHPPINHHRLPGLQRHPRVELVQHRLQRGTILHVAREDLVRQWKPLSIDDQPHHDLLAIRAVITRVPALGLGDAHGLALEVRRGQIVEEHGVVAVEQRALPLGQSRLDLDAPGMQPVQLEVERLITQAAEVDRQDVGQGGAPDPVGHGLSYTTFEYANLDISPTQVGAAETVSIRVDVTNVGERSGDEVVQLYVHDVVASVTRPVKELKGFKRIALEPGEKRAVRFDLAASQLAFYDRSMRLVVEPGAIEVLIGSSSEDIRLAGRFSIVGETPELIASTVFSTPISVE